MAEKLSHIDSRGNAHMVDVGQKPVTNRIAAARSSVTMSTHAFESVVKGSVPKGDVLSVVRIAGMQAAKKTSDLIPLCHPLPIEQIEIEIEPDKNSASFTITATVRCSGKTGVEMEALTAVSVAALTMYDMCKSLDKSITITDICLLSKSGGESGTYTRSDTEVSSS